LSYTRARGWQAHLPALAVPVNTGSPEPGICSRAGLNS